jgi:hypothetical protein
MLRWKKQILARASGFERNKKATTSVKPFSQPLVLVDLNSPASKISTPARVAIAAPMSNLPTPKVSTFCVALRISSWNYSLSDTTYFIISDTTWKINLREHPVCKTDNILTFELKKKTL